MSIDILLPTHKRPDHLAPLLENIAENTRTDHMVYLVCELTDEPTVDMVLNRLTDDYPYIAVIGHYGACAVAMNAGYEASDGTHVFTANDDLWFHPDWDLHALAVLDTGAKVVGTNDGNGRMTCFAMIERGYIQACSGVYDQPDQLYHPYVSQYCDTELADYAKHRGVWGEAPLSVTEHRHWEFGKADRNHPNYVKAQTTCAQDAATYQQRRAAWEAL